VAWDDEGNSLLETKITERTKRRKPKELEHNSLSLGSFCIFSPIFFIFSLPLLPLAAFICLYC
jgi:hypothetical protein